MITGLYFGSFNPIHIGHMAIANYIVENTEMNQLWFVVSPQNPFKERKTLLADHHRLELVERAIGDDERFRVTDIEFRMPVPSYTIDTLARLAEKHPATEFVIIMGSDGLPFFPKWKNASEIEKNYKRFVYPRPGYQNDTSSQSNLEIVDAPYIEISSSFIRKSISEGKDVRHFLPPGAREYLDEMNFYR
ncbi:MAG TPA: nicotinate-nucleotide adenylyltransferase [Bacteroides sp.]|nr:nicotinate-nucleotide adenylyltransferase [Bacteroides sp.]